MGFFSAPVATELIKCKCMKMIHPLLQVYIYTQYKLYKFLITRIKVTLGPVYNWLLMRLKK